MMRRASFILIAVAGALLAQSGINPPLAGFIRCEDVKLRPVYGLARDFVRGTPTALSLPGGARLLGEENEAERALEVCL